MEASSSASSIVIKVKHGEILRRFNAQIINEQLDLSIDGLRKKIHTLFSFAPDTELTLTYIDEDGDVVTLADDADLHDAVKQDLNPLRITVKVNSEKNGRQNNHSSGSSTPMGSPQVQEPLNNLNRGVSEILKALPEPLNETLSKLSAEFLSKATSSAPEITELCEHLSKVGLTYLGRTSEFQPGVRSGTQGNVPGRSTSATGSKDSERLNVPSKKLAPEATEKNKEVKIQNVTGGNKERSSFGFNGVAEAAVSESTNVALPKSGAQHPKSGLVPHTVGRKINAKNIVECYSNGKSHLTNHLPPVANNVPFVANNFAPVKDVNKNSEPKLGSDLESVHASVKSLGSIGVTNPGSLKFPGSFYPMYECPFSGNVSVVPPPPVSEAVPSRKSVNQNDGNGMIFHRGVRCDECGVYPITGPRFKSKIKLDYDLCSICFEEMGNEGDYIKMDRPVVYRDQYPFKGLHCSRGKDRAPTLPHHVLRGAKAKLGLAKLDNHFVHDVNISDGTFMAPSTPFTKIWRMRNNGTAVWPPKSQLVWIGGDKLSNALSAEVEIPAAGLPINQELDVAVDFISPDLPGRYISYWRMASPSGQKFGQRVWVLIQVDASVTEPAHESVRNLNLNLPPVYSSLTVPEIINVEPEPIIKNDQPENSKKVVGKLVQPSVDLPTPNNEHELKFPINDSLLVGNGASSSIPTSVSPPSISYPIIDLSDVSEPAPQAVSPGMFYQPLPQNASAGDVRGTTEVEEKLLRELEQMGFRQIDLNKEILRNSEYDLEQAVDHLCGVSEWDPILEELQEMGFHDTETNKKLLKKNNGSIKRVVMDLIAGEEEI